MDSVRFLYILYALWRKLVLVHCAVFLLSTTQHSRRAFYWLSACERALLWMGSFLIWARSFSTPFCPAASKRGHQVFNYKYKYIYIVLMECFPVRQTLDVNEQKIQVTKIHIFNQCLRNWYHWPRSRPERVLNLCNTQRQRGSRWRKICIRSRLIINYVASKANVNPRNPFARQR